MTKVRTTLLDIPELENLDLKTETRDGKRHYIDSEGNAYPSVTTVCGLKTKEQIKLWKLDDIESCLLYTSPSPRDLSTSRMPSSA